MTDAGVSSHHSWMGLNQTALELRAPPKRNWETRDRWSVGCSYSPGLKSSFYAVIFCTNSPHTSYAVSHVKKLLQAVMYDPSRVIINDGWKCKECEYLGSLPSGWFRWWGVDVVEDVVSIFTSAWNQLTKEKITHLSFSVLHFFEICREDCVQLQTSSRSHEMMWASSFHSHGSSFLQLCLAFFPIFSSLLGISTSKGRLCF